MSIFERRAALVFDWVTHRLDPPGEVPLTRVHLRLRLSRANCDRTLKRMIPIEVPHTPFVTERRYCGPNGETPVRCLCPASALRGAARPRAPATGRHGRRSRRAWAGSPARCRKRRRVPAAPHPSASSAPPPLPTVPFQASLRPSRGRQAAGAGDGPPRPPQSTRLGREPRPVPKAATRTRVPGPFRSGEPDQPRWGGS